jgi:hypothetical protein
VVKGGCKEVGVDQAAVWFECTAGRSEQRVRDKPEPVNTHSLRV